MPLITNVLRNQGKSGDRVYVYIDEKFCCSVRERTWIGMNLKVGTNISCDKLKTLEQNFWKKLYGQESWKKEKTRIDRVKKWFAKYVPEVKIISVGLGTDTIDYLENIHSKEKGSPDLSILPANSNIEILSLEVSGTEKMQGNNYWIRKDKIDYIQNHKEQDIWIVLHYKLPKEKFVWVKIIYNKSYQHNVLNIKGADEFYVIFSEKDEEVKTSSEFLRYVSDKLTQYKTHENTT